MHQYDLTEQEFSGLQALHQVVTEKGKADCESHILLGKDASLSSCSSVIY